MTILLENETKEIIKGIKLADSYLDCERVIINNIKKHFKNGHKAAVIEDYCKKLKQSLEEKARGEKGNSQCINYDYAVGFLNTLIVSAYWHTWIMAA
ncbi:MAG: hypothetical protein JWP81_2422 [Ferruginibacter sp.]|nr:hypothetical protein [Ferruginibacter sp.]